MVAAIDAELRLAADHAPGRTELELVYDGTRPPEALFDSIARLGWHRPVAAPPPRSAVDWSTPDPVRGTRYTVRPFAAVVHLVPGERHDAPRSVDEVVAVARAHGVRIAPALEPSAGVIALVSVTVAPNSVDGVVGAVPQAAVVDPPARYVTRPSPYRGRTTETEQPAVWLLFQVPAEVLDEVISTLARSPVLVAPRIEPGSGRIGSGGSLGE